MAIDNVAPRATSLDVARLAGLSRTTVSQILNGRDARFPQETRDRVAAAAAQLNYRPSRAGRALVSGISDLIVIVVPNVTVGRRLQDAIEQIATESAAVGMNAVIRYAGADDEATLATILDLRPAAVFHLGALDVSAIRAIEAAGTLVLPTVSPEQSNAEAFDHLLGEIQGRELVKRPLERVVYASPAGEPGPYAPARAEGLARFLRSAGHPPPQVIDVSMVLEEAVAALRPVLRGDGPTGVACYNDDVAVAVLAVARTLGKTVPGDVAVVGVDRTDIGQLVTPRLTTIAINLPLIDSMVLGELAQLRRGTEVAPVAHDTSLESLMRLVPGEST